MDLDSKMNSILCWVINCLCRKKLMFQCGEKIGKMYAAGVCNGCTRRLPGDEGSSPFWGKNASAEAACYGCLFRMCFTSQASRSSLPRANSRWKAS